MMCRRKEELKKMVFSSSRKVFGMKDLL